MKKNSTVKNVAPTVKAPKPGKIKLTKHEERRILEDQKRAEAERADKKAHRGQRLMYVVHSVQFDPDLGKNNNLATMDVFLSTTLQGAIDYICHDASVISELKVVLKHGKCRKVAKKSSVKIDLENSVCDGIDTFGFRSNVVGRVVDGNLITYYALDEKWVSKK